MRVNRRILIVDDNSNIHEDIKLCLTESMNSEIDELNELEEKILGQAPPEIKNIHYEIDSAFQGEEALVMIQKAKDEKKPYAMCFMDVRMPPGIDGLETIKKAWEIQKNLECVICTAFSDHSWDDIVSELGLSDKVLFLRKPFEPLVIKQFALSTTQKWSLKRHTERILINLNQVIKRRTADLQNIQSMTLETSKMKALGEMAGGIAHEINNPLTVILTSNELMKPMLENSEDSEKLLKFNSKISSMTDRIVSIIKSLRNVAGKNDSKGFKVVNLRDIFADIQNLYGKKLVNRSIDYTVNSCDGDLSFECLQSQMSQALINLIINSMEAFALQEDNDQKMIKLDVSQNHEEIEICYTDNGPGITDQVKMKIFEPFTTTKIDSKAAGLGLAITRGVLETHKGSIQFVECETGVKFLIKIPRKTDSQEHEKAA